MLTLAKTQSISEIRELGQLGKPASLMFIVH